MKNKLAILAFLMILPLLVMAQTPVNDRWLESGNASVNSELFSIDFPTATVGYAVGSGGACLKTINGGASWSAINLNVPYDLLKITFLDANVGFIGGRSGYEYGKVLKTTDGGENWQEVLHMPGRLNNMFFLDGLRGWITGYEKIIQTVDGGATWITREPSGFNDILSVVFVTPTVGFMAPNNASAGVQITRDGGITWSQTFNTYINGLENSDENTIYAIRNSPGMIYKTTDQGATWNSASTGLSGSLNTLNFVTSSTGFVWSQDPHFGRIYRTSNAGQQWTLVYDNPLVNINHVEMAPGGKIFAVGSGGLILTSTDGSQWNTVHNGLIKGTLRRVAFTDNLHGFAVGDKGSMIKTSDGGVNWTPVDLGIQTNLAGLDFVTDQKGFLAGDNNVFYKTTNGGTTWTSANSGLNTPELRQIAAFNDQTVFAGSNSGIYVTKNGGTTWNSTAYSSIAYTMFMIDADTLLAAGIVNFNYSYNGGTSWNTKSMPRTFFSMYFTSSKKGFVGDSWGRIHKTIDGMETRDQKFDCGKAVYDMTFINDTIGYFVADNGYIGKTTDGGESWFQVESGTIRDLKSIFFTPDGTGFIVGKDGMILRKAAVDTYTIDFKVFDEGEHPINDAIVTINNSVYPAGVYTIKGLIEGTYSYTVSHVGFKSYKGSIMVADDEEIEVVLSAGIDAPVARNASDISNTGFTANWDVVVAADQYLLYVSNDGFTTHAAGFNGTEVEGLSHVVSGLEQAGNYSYRLKAISTFAESDFSNIISVSGSSYIDNPIVKKILLYPNPADNVIRIETGDIVAERIDLFDSVGRLALSWSDVQTTANGYELDVSGLTPGFYRLQLQTSDNRLSISVIKR